MASIFLRVLVEIGQRPLHEWRALCATDNRYSGGVTYEYGVALDKKFGRGTAAFLEKLSRKTEPWETRELDQLRAAAKYGSRVYEQTYFELRPHHKK